MMMIGKHVQPIIPEGVSDEWSTIPWRKLERYIFRLQKRIYKAKQRGDTRAVRGLKRVLKRSKAAKTLAVRQVTQDNRGKRTAGIDGVKNLNPVERLAMASKLTLEGKATPVRRIWIPKPGKDEKRPLGIPTMMDRARQALAKMALEPEWEAVFEPNSYGFRPGRSCHDAIEQIHTAMRKEKYILEADIKGCFDSIDRTRWREVLRQRVNDGRVLRLIGKWLRAGVLEQGALTYPETGVVQGGVISPLLSNLYLTDVDRMLERAQEVTRRGKYTYLAYARFADDLVILVDAYRDHAWLLQAVDKRLRQELAILQVAIHEEKSRIVDLAHGETFSFLGCDFRRVKSLRGVWRPCYTPMPKKRTALLRKLKDIFRRYVSQPVDRGIALIYPILRGSVRRVSGMVECGNTLGVQAPNEPMELSIIDHSMV